MIDARGIFLYEKEVKGKVAGRKFIESKERIASTRYF